ncbi:hypothetical protein AA0115_g11735 [Alternaria tenuissima]|nr:hypothetical protein AA0115_g11735 [Alternaria tenuissima]
MNEIDPTTKTIITAQDFCSAVSSFASHDSVKALTEVLDLLPQRENDIISRDNTIRALKNELATKNELHKGHTQQLMSDLEDRFKSWILEKKELENEVKEVRDISDAKDKALELLRENLETSRSRAEDLERDIAQKTTRLKEMIQQVSVMEGRLQTMQVDEKNYLQEAERSRSEIDAIKKSLEDSEKMNQTLEEKFAKAKKTLDHYLQYSVEMKKLDLSETAERIEKIWQSSISLIADFAGQELPEDVLQIDWNELRKKNVFKDQIPLPRTNSDIAKLMRVAMVVEAFATLVDRFVFQPTYLLNETSRLREILCQQASTDPGRERFARGILLSMSSDSQEVNSKDGEDVLDSVLDELLRNSMMRSLFTAEDISSLDKELTDLVIQFQEEWEKVQRGKQKLEADFCHSNSTDHTWNVISMRATKYKEDQHSELFSDSGIYQEDDIVIVPQVYVIIKGEEKTPLTHGFLLRKADLDAAKDEARRNPPTATSSRAPPGHQRRRRPSQTTTVTSQTSSGPSRHRSDRIVSRARGVLGV